MKRIDEVIVVEGKHDSEKLKKYFDVETIETNGSHLSYKTIEMIKEVNLKRGVILLLDPDSVGEKIRNILNNEIEGLKNAFLFKEECRTSKKVGIEHASYEVLHKALLNYFVYDRKKESLTFDEFVDLGLLGSGAVFKRDKVSKAFNLGKCNAKTLFKRLNMIEKNKKDIEEVL